MQIEGKFNILHLEERARREKSNTKKRPRREKTPAAIALGSPVPNLFPSMNELVVSTPVDNSRKRSISPLLSNYAQEMMILIQDEEDPFTFEKTEKSTIIKILQKGSMLKGSGLGKNSGSYNIRLDEDRETIIRENLKTNKREKRSVYDIKELAFQFEYRVRDKEGKLQEDTNMQGNSISVLKFTPKNKTDNKLQNQYEWQFATPKGLRAKHIFWSTLLKFRLNKKEFQKAIGNELVNFQKSFNNSS